MERIDLVAERRETLGKKVRALRRRGLTPANLYGPGRESIPLQLETAALERALGRIRGPCRVWLAVPGEEPAAVVIQEVQRDPRRGHLLHVDFYRPA